MIVEAIEGDMLSDLSKPDLGAPSTMIAEG
jgi:hypothetical protein